MAVDITLAATAITSILTLAGAAYGLLYKGKYSKQIGALADSAQFMAQVSGVIAEITVDLADKQVTPEELERITAKLLALKTTMDRVEAELVA